MLFKDKVNEIEVMQGVRSLTMTTAIKDVVTISGSLEGGSLYAPTDNKQIANIATAMIDKGTDQKDKYEISDILDSIGAEISFSSSSNHINFTAHCMKKDLKTIMHLIAEQLSTPSLKENELELLKTTYFRWFLRWCLRRRSDPAPFRGLSIENAIVFR